LAVVQGCGLEVKVFESEVQLLQEFCREVQVRGEGSIGHLGGGG
jgi:hypothetical protein